VQVDNKIQCKKTYSNVTKSTGATIKLKKCVYVSALCAWRCFLFLVRQIFYFPFMLHIVRDFHDDYLWFLNLTKTRVLSSSCSHRCSHGHWYKFTAVDYSTRKPLL